MKQLDFLLSNNEDQLLTCEEDGTLTRVDNRSYHDAYAANLHLLREDWIPGSGRTKYGPKGAVGSRLTNAVH